MFFKANLIRGTGALAIPETVFLKGKINFERILVFAETSSKIEAKSSMFLR